MGTNTCSKFSRATRAGNSCLTTAHICLLPHRLPGEATSRAKKQSQVRHKTTGQKMNPEIKRELDDVTPSTTFSLGKPGGGGDKI